MISGEKYKNTSISPSFAFAFKAALRTALTLGGLGNFHFFFEGSPFFRLLGDPPSSCSPVRARFWSN